MKVILNILIVLIMSVNCSLYDWHVRTIERDSEFGDDLKVQTALNKERQQDLLKISGKMSNTHYYPNINYKNIAVSGNKFDDILPQNDKLYDNNIIKAKNKYNDQDFIFENLQYKNFNKNIKNNEINNKKSLNKNSNNNQYVMEDNNSNHNDFIYIKNVKLHDSTKNQGKSNDTTLQLEIKTKNIEDVNEEVNKTFKVNNTDTSTNHCSGKYTDIVDFVGTNLFDSTSKSCFTNEEVALLTIRKDFEVSL